MSGDPQIYSAFGSPEAAAQMTGGEVYRIKNRDPGNAFVLRDAQGRQFIYVHTEYGGYRGLANRAAGEQISKQGDDADHTASRTVAGARGGHYVLLARVPSQANRSAGTVERVDVLDGHFNYAAARRADDGHLALAMTNRQSQKLRGRMVDDYDRHKPGYDAMLSDPAMQRALLQTEADQQRIADMCGDRIAARNPDKSPVPEQPKTAWDRHRAAPDPTPQSSRRDR